MSRFTVIKEMSDDITGTFPLYDLLSISTMSGSINITIVPQPASSAKAPAELRLRTWSGSIRVTMAPSLNDPSTVIPERVFDSSIEAMSGSITAALVHNHRTFLSTQSGSINVSLYPLRQPTSTSHVGISCMSGSASLHLHPFVGNPQTSLRTLSADLHSGSGNFKVRFPSTWEGEVNSNLGRGRVKHEWEGLRVLNDGSSFRAMNGNGSGRLNIMGGSGSVELVAEKVPGLPRQEVREAGERVPVGLPDSRGEMEVQERDGVPDLPKEQQRQEQELEDEEEDDDDWTIVGDEDGAEERTKKPPPSYEDATQR